MIIHPKKYKGIAQDRIANLVTYLRKAYGDPIPQSLSINMQQLIHECTWDEEIGRPLKKLDREVDNILKTGDDLDYVDNSLITMETTQLSDTIESNTFITELDTNTVSTFGTVKDTTAKAVGLSNTPVIHVDKNPLYQELLSIVACLKWNKNSRVCLTC